MRRDGVDVENLRLVVRGVPWGYAALFLLVTFGSRKSISLRLDLLNRRDWQTSPPLDELSHSLTSDVGSRDVGWMCDRLEQANAEDLDSSCADSPKPASERTSFDYVSEIGEVWQRHRFSCISRS